MKTLIKSAALSALLVAAAPAALAQTAPAGPIATGIAVANIDAVVANSNAFKTAQQQRLVTYKPQIDAAEARRAQISAQLNPMVDKFNRDRAAATTPTAQAALQQQAQSIQSIQQNGQAELQKMLEPVAMSEAYVSEQVGDKINQAVQSAMAKRKVTLVISPQSVIAAANSYNLNQDILNELNTLIPNAQIVPPAGWQPREVREAQAAQAQQGRPAAPPAKSSSDGR